MAEKTNKGMNFLFTPTLIEFEKTISLPMLSRKFQTHPVPVLSQVQKFLQHPGKANAKLLPTNDNKIRSQ